MLQMIMIHQDNMDLSISLMEEDAHVIQPHTESIFPTQMYHGTYPSKKNGRFTLRDLEENSFSRQTSKSVIIHHRQQDRETVTQRKTSSW